jgi:nucleoside phosphorylase
LFEKRYVVFKSGVLVDLIDDEDLMMWEEFDSYAVSVTNMSVTVLRFCCLGSRVLVDLIDDEDLEMMWEEFDSYAVSVSNMLQSVLQSCRLKAVCWLT